MPRKINLFGGIGQRIISVIIILELIILVYIQFSISGIKFWEILLAIIPGKNIWFIAFNVGSRGTVISLFRSIQTILWLLREYFHK